ncbi:hypothetical protein JK202_04055 [Gluconobacter sp. Dm-62]|nr:hypothetical protein [Gluconobacter sp. Dm-62]
MVDSVSHHVRETDPTLLRLKLFGQMEAKTLTGESVLPVGSKTRALLAILALSDRKPVLRSRLAELLWSKRPEDLARASLRQEIHRLLDALSPIGVEVIDVQRHSLALKSALTSVDAEKLLTVSVRTIDAVAFPEEPLLGELAGVDPALDDWLVQQRRRLSAHLQNVCESAVQELTDSDRVEATAERLLKFDGLNEIAWRARIQLALHRGDYGRAVSLSDQMARVVEDVEGHVLSPATQKLLASIPDEHTAGEPVQDAVQPALSGSNSEVTSLVSVRRPDPMLALPLHYAAQHSSSMEPQKIALVFLAPSCTDETLLGYRQSLRDQLELMFVNMGTFDILSIADISSPDSVNAPSIYQSLGADYVISGSLRAGQEDGADNRLILRVLDARRGGVIIWGTHFDFPSSGPDEATNSIVAPMQAMQWSIFVAEARRIAARSDAELSALGMALRAFMLLLRHDCTLFDRIGFLLERAVDLGKDDGAIALIDALYCYIRFLNEWGIQAESVFARGLKSVRVAVSLMPDLHAVEVLLAAYLMYEPGSHEAAVSVARSAAEDISSNDSHHKNSPDLRMVEIVLNLLCGEMKSAAGNVKKLLENGYRSQLLELLRPVFMMILLLGEDYQKVISMGRLASGLYPSCPSSLVYYLVSLIEVNDFPEEAQQVRRHLLRLAPDLTVSKVVSRFPFVETAQRTRLTEALFKAGIAGE